MEEYSVVDKLIKKVEMDSLKGLKSKFKKDISILKKTDKVQDKKLEMCKPCKKETKIMRRS